MKIKEKLKYISNRVLFMGGAAAILSVLVTGVLLWRAAHGELPLWTAALAAFATAAYILISWFWIVRPYMQWERMGKRFQEGYIFAENMNLKNGVLTPSILSQLAMLEKMLKSPQFMDLNKRQAQYLALQNQINPHFLYNTLESIRGEALLAGLDGVADMTEALAKFFRYTITKVENLVSVEEELDNCETYFGIQKYRFGERLHLHIEYEPEEYEEIMNSRIPKLTLQPILENSIIHGTELKMGAGNLYIRFECTQERLIIRISDDGVGMDEETLAKLNQKLGKSMDSLGTGEEKGGIALVNVNNRLHLIFGDEYGMHVYSTPQVGTDVEITIPLKGNDGQAKHRGALV